MHMSAHASGSTKLQSVAYTPAALTNALPALRVYWLSLSLALWGAVWFVSLNLQQGCCHLICALLVWIVVLPKTLGLWICPQDNSKTLALLTSGPWSRATVAERQYPAVNRETQRWHFHKHFPFLFRFDLFVYFFMVHWMALLSLGHFVHYILALNCGSVCCSI